MASNLLHYSLSFMSTNPCLLEIGYTTVIVPKMLGNIAMQSQAISITGCFIFFFLGSFESFLLTSMACDHYLDICKSLHYSTNMDRRAYCLFWGIVWVDSLHLPFPLPSFSACLSVVPTSSTTSFVTHHLCFHVKMSLKSKSPTLWWAQ